MTTRAEGAARAARAARAALAALAAFNPLAAPARAAPPAHDTHEARLRALYAPAPPLDARGEPLVSVRVAAGQARLAVSAQGGVALYLGADPGARLTLGREEARWELSLAAPPTPRARRWWAPLERLPAAPEGALAAREAWWRDQGLTPARLAVGLWLPGAEGGPLDARAALLAASAPDEEAARALAERLEGLDGARRAPLDTLEAPARGTLRVALAAPRAGRGALEASARDAVWVEPLGDGPLELTTWDAAGRARVTRYEGELYAVVSDGGLDAVNVLRAERLVALVVPSELYPSAPLEALKAQAVSARGQLVTQLGDRHLAEPYHLCGEAHCQVYRGAAARHARAEEAARATRGLLAVDAHGAPVPSVYSSTCGGRTEAYHEVWGGAPRPALLGVEDNAAASPAPLTASGLEALLSLPPAAFCAHPTRAFRWRVRRTAEELSAALRARLGARWAAAGALVRVEAARRGASGRALDVRYVGERGEVVARGELLNRQLLGLKSALWVAREEGGAGGRAWVFEGGGAGHGVGLCQHGAIGMAEAGRGHADILAHYYAGAVLRRAW